MHTFIYIFLYTLACMLIGLAASKLWPKSIQRSLTGICVSPALGLSILIVVANVIGWSVGFNSAVVIPIISIIIIISCYLVFSKILIAVYASLFAVLISFGCLVTVIKSGDLPYFQDAFTYLVHAQWLQNNAFRTPVESNPLYPSYTQVAFYQKMDLRMGASFLLGLFQKLSFATWSTDVYPATVGLLVAVGAIGVIGWVNAIVPGKKVISIAAGLALGFSIGGFGYGAVSGFLPQTCGLAISISYFAILSRFPLGYSALRWSNLLPLAILLASIGFAYSELLPFVLAATGFWFLSHITYYYKKQSVKQILMSGLVFLSIICIIWNFEIKRILNALLTQSGVVVGWAVPWRPLDFIAHSVGLRSGSGDGELYLLQPFLVYAILVFFILIALILILKILKSPRQFIRLSPLLGYISITTFAFVYFRWFSPSPWSSGLGQTWNQFKLANWASPSAVVLIAVILAMISLKKLAYYTSVSLLFLLAIGGLLGHSTLAKSRMNDMLRQTGTERNPLLTYKKLRDIVISENLGAPVYLDLSGAFHKGRQMAAFFLHDQPVLADWSDDGYIYPWLDSEWKNFNASDCSLLVQMKGASNFSDTDKPIAAIGSLSVLRFPNNFAAVTSVSGGYGVESDYSGWWSWCENILNINFKIHTGLGELFFLSFDGVPITAPRDLIITISGVENSHYNSVIPMVNGWNRYLIGPFRPVSKNINVFIESNGDSQKLSTHDTRKVKFLVKNAILQLENHK